MARMVKQLQKKVDTEQGHGFGHREHRSKKGRSYIREYARVRMYKIKKRDLTEKALYTE